MNLWHDLGEQLRHPRGLGGRLVGHVMRWANDRPTRLAVDALNPQRDEEILDLGCGGGHAVALIAARLRHGRVTGIDQSEVMIAQARAANAFALEEGRVQLMLGDFTTMSFPPASFDAILASNVIYFWDDPAEMIGRLRGLLRPGGRLVIYATAENSMREWKFAQTGTHHWISLQRLRGALVDGGFAPNAFSIDAVILPGGIEGLVAVAATV